jgi:hypothetical protein
MVAPRIENGELRIEDLNSQLSILNSSGAVAQMGEHLLCKQRVVGSIPISSTNLPRSIQLLESAGTNGEHNRAA